MAYSSVQHSVCPPFLSLYKKSLKEPCSSLLHVLSTTRSSLLFAFIDTTIEKRILDLETANLILDILRHINNYTNALSTIISKLATNEQHFRSFLLKQLTCAHQIAATSDSILSPVYTSAQRLVESIAGYKDQGENLKSIEECWQDFLLHFYRHKLYRYVMS